MVQRKCIIIYSFTKLTLPSGLHVFGALSFPEINPVAHCPLYHVSHDSKDFGFDC